METLSPTTAVSPMTAASRSMPLPRVRDAVGLDGEEALVVEEAVGEAGAGRVPGAHGEEVGDGGGADGGVRGEGADEEVVEERGDEGGGAELVGEVEGEGALKRGVGEHGSVEEGRERRLVVGVAARLGLDLGPDPRLVAVRLRWRVGRYDVGVEGRRGVAELLPCRHCRRLLGVWTGGV
jgi:hypothetical protein